MTEMSEPAPCPHCGKPITNRHYTPLSGDRPHCDNCQKRINKNKTPHSTAHTGFKEQ